MRGPHAFCVYFTPCLAAVAVKYRAKPLGMVLVNQSGLIMKLRGMRLELPPESLGPNPICFFWPNHFFLFLFDRGWSFL
jgi:hypothetical protein